MSTYYIVSSLVGASSPGSYSPDIYYMSSDGRFVLNDAANSILNTAHPIQQITVFTSLQGIIDGLIVTYNLEGGNTAVMNHGNTSNPSLSGIVSFGENEVLATVYGFAGFYAWYRGTRIGSIAFVLYDTETKESRTVGPFGDKGREPSFSVSDALAFGSFGQDSGLGLPGLVFFKNPSNSIDKASIPASDSTN